MSATPQSTVGSKRKQIWKEGFSIGVISIQETAPKPDKQQTCIQGVSFSSLSAHSTKLSLLVLHLFLLLQAYTEYIEEMMFVLSLAFCACYLS